MIAPNVWCPACGAEYTIGSRYCNECRVELVFESPRPSGNGGPDMTDMTDDETGDATDLDHDPRLAERILSAGDGIDAELA